jgi:hypothetical protein
MFHSGGIAMKMAIDLPVGNAISIGLVLGLGKILIFKHV